MIEFGETLRKAREAKGLNVEQIAESTHMMVQMVEDLENENFSKIPAPIYGRGFVKLYCEAVGLDPKPLIAEFMDIFNGNRPPTIRMRPTAPSTTQFTKTEPSIAVSAANVSPQTPSPTPTQRPRHQTADSLLTGRFTPVAPRPAPAATPAPAAAPQPAAMTQPAVKAPEPPVTPLPPAFTLEQETIPQPAAHTPFAQTAKEAPAAPARTPSRYAAPILDDDPHPRRVLPKLNVPPAVWRILALAVAATLILWLLLASARALYKATMTAPEAEEPVTTTQQQPAATSPDKPGKSPATSPEAGPSRVRRPMSLPPLYID